MTTPLLATKWFAPPVRSDAVRRPGLVQRLERGARAGHVVLAAPAGFGKSTLAAQWLAATRMPAAWLSLGEEDREPLRLLAYLAAATRTLEPGPSDAVERALRASPPPRPDLVAAEFVNALAQGDTDLAVVLDDYHLVDDGPVPDLVAFLIEHAPPRFHLVLTTRDEPQLPLARLRARGRLLEIGSDDLRFADAEAATFLNEAMGLDLAAEDAATLRRTTEGWAAGLQLAGLSLRGRADPSEAVRRFAGHSRHVLDYLSDEVLAGVDAAVRSFLLDVSVLDRLSAPLCDAVTGRDDAAEMLERLERANLFLVRLDDERRWYRFHALFADVVRSEAQRDAGRDVREQHRRARRWFAAQGATGEAIAHALAAGDVDDAAALLEGAWRSMDRNFQMPTWNRWAEPFPQEILRARPVLAVALAWSRLTEGDMAGAERWLADAEAWLEARRGETAAEARAAQARDVTDDVAFRGVPARIAAARAYTAGAAGDVEAAERFARQAVDLAPDDDPGARAVPAGLLGLSAWARGALDRALEDLRLAMRSFRDLGDAAAALSFTFAIAEIQTAQGRLRDAIATFEEALRYAERQPGGTLPGEAEAHAGLAELLAQRGDLGEAEVELRAGEALGDAGILLGDEARLTATRARVEFALGNAETALALLDEADTRAVAGPVPDVRTTGATRARIRLAQGRTAEARAWADDLGAPADLVPSYVDDDAHLTLVRVLLGRYRDDGDAIDEALALLGRLIDDATGGGRVGTVIEARVLEALARQAAGDDEAARNAILDALRRSEAEGHQAVFVGEGPAIAGLLRAAGSAGAGKRQVRRLLAALGSSTDRQRVHPDLVEPLSDRERDVLRLLRGDMSGPQIARELGMSVHTFRSHTKSIYAKLGVHGRKQAIARAGELGID